MDMLSFSEADSHSLMSVADVLWISAPSSSTTASPLRSSLLIDSNANSALTLDETDLTGDVTNFCCSSCSIVGPSPALRGPCSHLLATCWNSKPWLIDSNADSALTLDETDLTGDVTNF